jgi:hypothetical protein
MGCYQAQIGNLPFPRGRFLCGSEAIGSSDQPDGRKFARNGRGQLEQYPLASKHRTHLRKETSSGEHHGIPRRRARSAEAHGATHHSTGVAGTLWRLVDYAVNGAGAVFCTLLAQFPKFLDFPFG